MIYAYIAGVYGVAFLLIMTIWNVYRLRYFYRSGYRRATFLLEDGRTADITFRPKKPVDNSFDMKIAGKMRTFHIQKDRTYKWGRARLPHTYHHVAQSESIDMYALKAESEATSEVLNELKTNTVVRGLLDKFDTGRLSVSTAFMLVTLILLAGMVLLGFFIDSRIAEIAGT